MRRELFYIEHRLYNEVRPLEIITYNRCSLRESIGFTAFIYAAAHFAVDFACAYLMFKLVFQSSSVTEAALIYNFCAFALQMPLGLLADKTGRGYLYAAGGILLVSAAFILPGLASVLAAGIGNALFHIGGGHALLTASDKASPLGVFVSTGALGLYLGARVSYTYIPLILLLLSFILVLLIRKVVIPVKTAPIKLSKGLAAASLLLIAVVFLRSYSGLSIHFEWAKEGVWGLMLVLAVVLGKAAGGFLLDRFGAITVSAVSLLLAAAGFLVSSGPVFGILSVLLFNMTMPVTLWALARAMPGFKGLSFGLLTFALFIGYLMLWLGLPLPSTNSMYALISLISLILLIPGLKAGRL